MPGQYGHDTVTVRNQKVVMVDKENNLILIRGAVPGPASGYVVINPTNYLPEPKLNKWRLTKKITEPAPTEPEPTEPEAIEPEVVETAEAVAADVAEATEATPQEEPKNA
jgi:hypothetical protein